MPKLFRNGIIWLMIKTSELTILLTQPKTKCCSSRHFIASQLILISPNAGKSSSLSVLQPFVLWSSCQKTKGPSLLCKLLAGSLTVFSFPSVCFCLLTLSDQGKKWLTHYLKNGIHQNGIQAVTVRQTVIKCCFTGIIVVKIISYLYRMHIARNK